MINNWLPAQIIAALQAAGRTEPWQTILVAASKTRTPDEIAAARAIGVCHFGENYVQEAERKKLAYGDATLHLIGALQKNKVRKAVALFDVIHTVDSLALAERINLIAGELGKKPRIYLQVNLINEPQKAGIKKEFLSSLVEKCRHFHNLELVGLMTIPTAGENPEPAFSQLQQLAKQHALRGLSMGMSADWPLALKHGATLIRVGNSLFSTKR